MTAHDTNLAEVRRLLPPGVSLIARDDDALILRARRGGARYVAVTLGVLAAILGAVAWIVDDPDVPTREQAFAVAGILAERLGLPAPRDPTAATTPG